MDKKLVFAPVCSLFIFFPSNYLYLKFVNKFLFVVCDLTSNFKTPLEFSGSLRTPIVSACAFVRALPALDLSLSAANLNPLPIAVVYCSTSRRARTIKEINLTYFVAFIHCFTNSLFGASTRASKLLFLRLSSM